MEIKSAVTALSALAHEGRLRVFRLLVQAGSAGVAAGDIARQLNMLTNTLSANLNLLSNASLVQSRREGRSIIYSVQYDHMRDLLAYLVEDCCAGSPQICAPLADVLRTACCADTNSTQ